MSEVVSLAGAGCVAGVVGAGGVLEVAGRDTAAVFGTTFLTANLFQRKKRQQEKAEKHVKKRGDVRVVQVNLATLPVESGHAKQPSLPKTQTGPTFAVRAYAYVCTCTRVWSAIYYTPTQQPHHTVQLHAPFNIKCVESAVGFAGKVSQKVGSQRIFAVESDRVNGYGAPLGMCIPGSVYVAGMLVRQAIGQQDDGSDTRVLQCREEGSLRVRA